MTCFVSEAFLFLFFVYFFRYCGIENGIGTAFLRF